MTGQSYIFFYMNIYEFIWIYINKFIYISLYLILPFTLYLSSDLLWLPIIMKRLFREPLRVLQGTSKGSRWNLWRFIREPMCRNSQWAASEPSCITVLYTSNKSKHFNDPLETYIFKSTNDPLWCLFFYILIFLGFYLTINKWI